MAEGPRRGVTRRALVSGALAGLALPAAGCGIRLEDDAPRVPLVPTRTPVPAEAELVALTRDTRALAELAATVSGPVASDLVVIHRRQHTVLRTTLVRRQVPATDLDASSTAPAPSSTGPSPTSPGTTGPSTTSPSAASPSPGPAPTASAKVSLAEAEAAAAASAGTFADVEPDLRATIAALHAQRYAAATLLSGRHPVVPREPVSGPDVEALAASTSAAIYLFEVVSARTDGAQRKRSDATLATLRDLRADQVAGGSVPDDTIGHPLPFDVDTAAEATRLAREVLSALRAGYGEHLGPLVESAGGPGLEAATRWLGTVEVEAHRWGLDLVPFPGLG
jgi:Domain of unknown function (DUF4439)